jgi:hypothetical protein
MREEIQAENEGVTIPAQVRWLSNPRTIKEREQRAEIKASSVVFMVKGKKVAQRLVSKGVNAVGVLYKVEPYTNAGPDSLCELCCGWGHTESKCNNPPKCSYCAGPHRLDEHRCNIVGCGSKQGASCCHTQEQCPNCKGNHIAFSGKCAKRTEAVRMARQSRRMQPKERETGEGTGANRTALGIMQARDIRNEAGEPMADGEADDTGEKAVAEEERDVTMTETAGETEMGAAASND